VTVQGRGGMARSISDEELQLRKRARRRLIGAIVLVTAVVVALPMVLDTDPKPINQDIAIRIPSPDSGPFTSKVVPVAPPLEAKPEAKPPAAAPKPPAAPEDKSAKPAPAPAQAKAPSKPAAAEPAPKPAAGQYVLQVIALADAGKARQIQQQVSAAGIRSYTEVVKTAKGDVTRVRAGPFESTAAAEKARAQLQQIEFDGKKLDGKIIPAK
jgi:DedD protein